MAFFTKSLIFSAFIVFSLSFLVSSLNSQEINSDILTDEYKRANNIVSQDVGSNPIVIAEPIRANLNPEFVEPFEETDEYKRANNIVSQDVGSNPTITAEPIEETDEYKRANNIIGTAPDSTQNDDLLNAFDEILTRYQIIEDKFKNKFYAKYSSAEAADELYERAVSQSSKISQKLIEAFELNTNGAPREAIENKIRETNIIILDIANEIKLIIGELSNTN